MDHSVYQHEADIEEHHWWFVGRRRLFANLIRRHGVSTAVPVLDVGTSTGTNLRMLRDLTFDHVTGLDQSLQAAAYCRAKGFGPVEIGDVCQMPFADETFGLVLATDIVEHVDDDAAALAEITRVTETGGTVLITVPAFKALWGHQDEVSHHRRRYVAREITERVEAAGLRIERAFYFNYILFPAIWAARRLIFLFRIQLESENQVNTGWLNWILGQLFRLDVATAPVVQPPFGVSFLVLAKKPLEDDNLDSE